LPDLGNQSGQQRAALRGGRGRPLARVCLTLPRHVCRELVGGDTSDGVTPPGERERRQENGVIRQHEPTDDGLVPVTFNLPRRHPQADLGGG
jgi:hypothetical protein